MSTSKDMPPALSLGHRVDRRHLSAVPAGGGGKIIRLSKGTTPLHKACQEDNQGRGGAYFVSRSTLDECERLAKQWLILGVGIAVSDSRGRHNHVHGVKREFIDLREHIELDFDASLFA